MIPDWLKHIEDNERKQNELFAKWIKSPHFRGQNQERRESDLGFYVAGLLAEIANLQSDIARKEHARKELGF